jgi:membrane associated rhomboid family serine protease
MSKEKFRWVALIIVVVIIFIHSLQVWFPIQSENFALVSSKVLERPWTLITYMFLHENLSHLYFNMVALALFGSILESIIGYKKFLIVFFLTGIFSGIISTLFYSTIIGASGAIFGILGVLVVIRPWSPILAIGVPMPVIIAVVIWAVFDLLGIFNPADQIAHFGHLAGLGFGLVIGLFLREKYKLEKKEEKPALTDEELDEWEEKWMKRRKI